MSQAITINSSNIDYFSDKLFDILIKSFEDEKPIKPFLSDQSLLDAISDAIDDSKSNILNSNISIDSDELEAAGFSLSSMMVGQEQQTKEVTAAPKFRLPRIRRRPRPSAPSTPSTPSTTAKPPSGTSKPPSPTTTPAGGTAPTISPGASAKTKSKFRKRLEASWAKIKSKLSPFLWMSVPDVLRFVWDTVTGWFDKNWNNIVNKVTEPSFWREIILDYNAMRRIQDSMESEMYAPSAYTHILEMDGARGYGGQQHSQGAYEMPSSQLKSDMKSFIPDPVGTSRYKDPDIQSALQKSSNIKSKFVKISQATSVPAAPTKPEPSEQNKKLIEGLQTVMPNWTVADILNEIKPIADDPKLSIGEKQRQVVRIVNKYSESATSLYNYLKNNFGLTDIA